MRSLVKAVTIRDNRSWERPASSYADALTTSNQDLKDIQFYE